MVDSGYSRHMTESRDNFSELVENKISQKVELGGTVTSMRSKALVHHSYNWNHDVMSLITIVYMLLV